MSGPFDYVASSDSTFLVKSGPGVVYAVMISQASTSTATVHNGTAATNPVIRLRSNANVPVSDFTLEAGIAFGSGIYVDNPNTALVTVVYR